MSALWERCLSGVDGRGGARHRGKHAGRIHRGALVPLFGKRTETGVVRLYMQQDTNRRLHTYTPMWGVKPGEL